LVANDEAILLTMLEALFEKQGMIVDTAINGQLAYELVL
jgi:CheY-like chemotaxis protein